MENGIIILDFGSQYNQLIARRIRDLGVYSEVVPYFTATQEILAKKPCGIILSGGPSSVNAEDAHLIEKDLLLAGIPVLGICYGMQLITHLLGGQVAKGQKGEYGKSDFIIEKQNALLGGLPSQSTVWMSHFDEVVALPEGFELSGKSGVIAAIANEAEKIYCVQFHPEVSHTEYGEQMLKNFIFEVCKAEKNWKLSNYIETAIAQIKEKVGKDKVILGLSGGVDSSVAATLIHRAIGDQLTCIFVDTGLLRKDEGKKVMENYGNHFHMNIKMVNAAERFLSKLKGVSDPEQKRNENNGHQYRIGQRVLAAAFEQPHSCEVGKQRDAQAEQRRRAQLDPEFARRHRHHGCSPVELLDWLPSAGDMALITQAVTAIPAKVLMTRASEIASHSLPTRCRCTMIPTPAGTKSSDRCCSRAAVLRRVS